MKPVRSVSKLYRILVATAQEISFGMRRHSSNYWNGKICFRSCLVSVGFQPSLVKMLATKVGSRATGSVWSAKTGVKPAYARFCGLNFVWLI